MKVKPILLVAISATMLASCGGQQITPDQAETQLKAMQAKVVAQEVKIPLDVTVHSEARLKSAETGPISTTTELNFYPSKTYIHQKTTATTGNETLTAETWLYVRENQFVLAVDAGGVKSLNSLAITGTPAEYFDAKEEVIEFAHDLGEAIGNAYKTFQSIFDTIRQVDDFKIEVEALGGSLSYSSDFETKNEGNLKGTFSAEAKKGEDSLSKQELAIEFDNYVPVKLHTFASIKGEEIAYAEQTYDWKVGNVVYPDLSTWPKA